MVLMSLDQVTDGITLHRHDFSYRDSAQKTTLHQINASNATLVTVKSDMAITNPVKVTEMLISNLIVCTCTARSIAYVEIYTF